MSRRCHALTADTVDDLDPACRACVVWELDPVAARRARTGGDRAQAKADWVARTLLEWGSCGQIVSVDGTPAGHITYAPAHLVPGYASYATAPVAADAVAMAGMRVYPDFVGAGLGRILVQSMAADLTRRGVRAVEAVAWSGPPRPDPAVTGSAGMDLRDGVCLVPAEFLLAVGFKTVRPHPRTPRLRLDLRATVSWRDDLVEAALERLLGRHRPVRQPALRREPHPR